MRQLVFCGPRRLAVEPAEMSPLQPDELRLRVIAAGICGSDVHGYSGANDRRQPGQVMGHEVVGEVVEHGADVHEPELSAVVVVNPVVSCGDCPRCLAGNANVCDGRRLVGCTTELPGAFADQMVVPAASVVPFAGTAPVTWGALVEPFAVGEHAVGLAGDLAESATVVVGGGPIGLGAALAARRHGARRLVIVEPVRHRRELLEQLGLDAVPPGSDRGEFDVAIECVGHAATLEAALGLVRPAGVVVVPGLGEPSIRLEMSELVMGERTLRGSAVYRPEDFRATAQWVAGGELDLGAVIEDEVSLDGLEAAFAGYAEGARTAFKTILVP